MLLLKVMMASTMWYTILIYNVVFFLWLVFIIRLHLTFLGTANQLTPLQLETLLTEGNKSKSRLVGFWTCFNYFNKHMESECMSLQNYCDNIVVGELFNEMKKIRTKRITVVLVILCIITSFVAQTLQLG